MEERDFSFGMCEEQRTMKETIARLVKGVVTDNAHDMDEKKVIPSEFIQKVWELGATISPIPEEYGGYGMEYSPIMNTIILEELAAGDMALAIAATLPSSFLYPILEMGTDEQKKKYIPPYCDGTYRPCTVAINEPRFKFDAVSLETKAVKKGGSYVITGEKCFVPMAKDSGHMLVAADLDGKGQLFIVSKDNPGVTIGEREKNLGLYALETYPVTFENCEVPEADRLGGSGGCDYAKFLQKSRIALSAIGTGVSRASFEYARDYSKERVQFGEPIASRQSIAFMIAEMAYEVDGMRLLTWKAASALEAGKDAKRESYLAKIFAGDATMKITDYGVQILGGHGFIRDHPVERYYRNGRGIAILEGMATV
ncbi:MAG TPA: acyl-CoA dehydrogenase family protein [Spirochaetota bacterium]|nr:acyl-CoA dehydrogenase family protein [Spirochaetota bacterium]